MKNNDLKIWHISDTHSHHSMLTIPNDIDIVIHSGDFSNYYDLWKNEPEARDFLAWYGNLDIKYKILIAGNHDAFAFHAKTELESLCRYYDIIYLENNSVEIEGFKIFGTPVTPTFGNWYFQKSRTKTNDVWIKIPEDTDILVVHGPPKGILDISENFDNYIEYCGCSSLKKRILNLNLKLVCFGHIHNVSNIINAGTMKLSISNTIFSNGSVVTDRKFGRITSNGNIINLNKNK